MSFISSRTHIFQRVQSIYFNWLWLIINCRSTHVGLVILTLLATKQPPTHTTATKYQRDFLPANFRQSSLLVLRKFLEIKKENNSRPGVWVRAGSWYFTENKIYWAKSVLVNLALNYCNSKPRIFQQSVVNFQHLAVRREARSI